MVIFKGTEDISHYLTTQRRLGYNVGFVPTMGALHDGHISLIINAIKICDTVVCSIFVNPTQFNNPEDFQKYPSTLEADIKLLTQAGTDVLFLPDVAEIYPEGTSSLPHYQLDNLEMILEGRSRPGHFQGVCQVMHRLLETVGPCRLFMGLKDYQQCMVVDWLIKDKSLPVQLETLPTFREKSGLAMSSRNMRLDNEQLVLASSIYECLVDLKERLAPGSLISLKNSGVAFLSSKGFEVDYVEIADAETLEIENEWNGRKPLVFLIAAFLGNVRLIDNLVMNRGSEGT